MRKVWRTDPGKALLWAAIIVLSFGFFITSVVEAWLSPAYRDPAPGNRATWALAHMIVAGPLLLIAPFQFSNRLRRRRPALHRMMGKTFLGLSLLAALSAALLGATSEFAGPRVPLTLFAFVWLFFTIAAWKAASVRDIATHRRFVIRSFAIALAFVWIRLLGDAEQSLFWFITSESERSTTREWLCFVLPLLVVEMALTWWPALKARKVTAKTLPA